jgi:hypothetical protein
MRLLERLQLRDLAHWARRRCLGRAASQSAIAGILPPLREHEGMDRERRGHRLHLHPRLLTQADGRELERITTSAPSAALIVACDAPSSLGGSVNQSGASTLVSFSDTLGIR